MADKHPYIPTQSYIVQVIGHLRKSLPPTITADTLRRLGFAPKNESYVLNVLRFLGLIDQDGNKTELASKTFVLHDDATFSQEFGKLIMEAYGDLFQLHGDSAWSLDADKLITFFRTSDQTTDVVGRLQASTFQALAVLSGRREAARPRSEAAKQSARATKKKPAQSGIPSTAGTPIPEPVAPSADQAGVRKKDLGLTVRIEINLPADGNQETYDRIFRSLRENLLGG